MQDEDRIEYLRSGLWHSKISAPKSICNVLSLEYHKSLNAKQKLHYNQLAGLHNPWGKSSHIFDSWALLDICMSTTILDLITPLIGPDIILWESAFYSYNALDSADGWTRHSDFSPLDPMQGIVVRIAIQPQGLDLEYLPGSHAKIGPDDTASTKAISLQLKAGEVMCHDIRLAQRYSSPCDTPPCGEYVIHYMPATSLFIRDPTSSIQQYLAEKLPLINYGKSPIWLVCGNDHRGNDFVTGFSPPVGQWTSAKW